MQPGRQRSEIGERRRQKCWPGDQSGVGQRFQDRQVGERRLSDKQQELEPVNLVRAARRLSGAEKSDQAEDIRPIFRERSGPGRQAAAKDSRLLKCIAWLIGIGQEEAINVSKIRHPLGHLDGVKATMEPQKSSRMANARE